jgi:hypothetical protein
VKGEAGVNFTNSEALETPGTSRYQMSDVAKEEMDTIQQNMA